MRTIQWGRQRSMVGPMIAIGMGGLLVGAGAALFATPKTGDELRRLLWRFVTRTVGAAERTLDPLLDREREAMENEGGLSSSSTKNAQGAQHSH